jgi:hypothetical protein
MNDCVRVSLMGQSLACLGKRESIDRVDDRTCGGE